MDSKDIKNSKTLPEEVYRHFIQEKLPRYQFTAIDVKERIKFIAYARELNRTNGIAFMKLVISWLRTHGVKTSYLLPNRVGYRIRWTISAYLD